MTGRPSAGHARRLTRNAHHHPTTQVATAGPTLEGVVHSAINAMAAISGGIHAGGVAQVTVAITRFQRT